MQSISSSTYWSLEQASIDKVVMDDGIEQSYQVVVSIYQMCV